MSEPLLALSDNDLRALSAALAAERLTAPVTPLGVARVLDPIAAPAVASELQRLAGLGFATQQLATMVELLVNDRARRSKLAQTIELVTTGPDAPGVTNRDTSVVVRELFAHAQTSANFTEAAQERNIEVGLLVSSPVLAEQIVRHFEALLESTQLHRAL